MAGPNSGTRPDDARRHNRTALLRRLHVDGPCTRATLASELGLNRSTIKAVVDGLAEAGVVTEAVPAQRSGAGRPSLLVLPEASAAVVLAVDVRVDQVSMAMVGIGGQILGRHSWNLHRTTRLPGEVITHVAESAQLLRDELGVREQSVGVSVPGVVRRADGLVFEAPNLGWREVGLGTRLEAVLGSPTAVGNDGDLGALAEHLRGAAREVADLLYLSADVGVGGGVIVGGVPFRGSTGYLGEIGHMIVKPGGRACFCGEQGCWETEVGEPALCRALGLPEDTPRGVLVAELRGLTRVDLLDEVRDWLVTGLVTAVNLLAPEMVVLGDLFAALPAALVERVREEVHVRSLVSRAGGGTRIEVSPLGRDGKLVGAAELAFEPVLGTV
ncbi:ROK family protein [Pseudonocardia oroxyli]|uniref:ROK family protein n=1 Tax=Pseudonocardia oroxyli TaxID=366584 RepID=UPI000B832A10|nr:ROK family protein [Pseudonocardia oroxyli]